MVKTDKTEQDEVFPVYHHTEQDPDVLNNIENICCYTISNWITIYKR